MQFIHALDLDVCLCMDVMIFMPQSIGLSTVLVLTSVWNVFSTSWFAFGVYFFLKWLSVVNVGHTLSISFNEYNRKGHYTYNVEWVQKFFTYLVWYGMQRSIKCLFACLIFFFVIFFIDTKCIYFRYSVALCSFNCPSAALQIVAWLSSAFDVSIPALALMYPWCEGLKDTTKPVSKK